MRPDLVVLAAVLGVTAAVALWWRARDGRVRSCTRSRRPLRRRPAGSSSAGPPGRPLWRRPAGSSAGPLWRPRRRPRAATERFARAELDAVGAPPGAWTLLEFVAPNCSPCAAARRVLESVAAERADVVVRAAGIDEHLDLVRSHRVLRAPTTFVLDPVGAVRGRASGVPDAGQLAEVIQRQETLT